MRFFDAVPVRAALCGAALVGLTGCASLVKQPQVALASIGLSSIGITGATARVELDVHNPNGFDLNARAVEYTLSFVEGIPADTPVGDDEWRAVASGRSADPVSLESGQTTPVTLLVPFSYSELGSAAASLLRDGRLRYRFAGAFTVGSPIGDIRIPFDQDGILDP